ncbi:ribitol-5-phosphate xylosyltransferase 1 [Hydra vulgaris]|uniref:Ribitol-5-phosphate xylosyltransferase 1 n=1 Tax=Hydra vulgaris TaxID=6087 RepID=A0ABM4C5M1_HYDVU
MKFIKKILCLVCTIVISNFLIWRFFKFKTQEILNNHVSINLKNSGIHKQKQVYVWGKAAISEYFWTHIIEGVVQRSNKYMWDEGIIHINSVKLVYFTGPALLPETAPKDIKDLVVILNGREEKKINASLTWLNSLLNKKLFPLLQNLGIIMLGNEQCNNSWLIDLCKQALKIKFVFIVYDINLSYPPYFYYQWPLGVATYRKFPLIKRNEVDLHSQRMYFCNFLGTIYSNHSLSSRSKLFNILTVGRLKTLCYTKVRYSWLPAETKETFELYHKVLKQSDLTLCPVGFNSESYRIYEAMSYGSVPIIEDVMTHGQCSKDFSSDKHGAPFRLLKKYNAPVMYVHDWSELLSIIELESKMPHVEKVKRREAILQWYEKFRSKMRDVFLEVLSKRFK